MLKVAGLRRAQSMPGTAERGPIGSGWWLLLPIVVLAATRELWAPDEPRYAEVAREAWNEGGLLVMHLNGALYPDKPPLCYWLAGAFGSLFGWREFAVRLPSLFSTAGTAWLCARLARRFWGELEARWSVFFYLGTAMVTEIGGRLQIDPLLSFLCMFALERASASHADARAERLNLGLAGLMLGCAALAKGPVAWLHVGLVLLVWSKLVPRVARIPLSRSITAWTGFVLLALAPVVLWASLAALREPSLWRPLFLGQHLGRVVRAENHAGPPWDYLTTLPLLLVPWPLVFVAGIASAWHEWRRSRLLMQQAASSPIDVGVLRAAGWFVSVFVVFSIIPVKRDLYLLPIYPAAALLCARVFARALRAARLSRWIAIGTVTIVGALGLVLCLAAILIERLHGLAALDELGDLDPYKNGVLLIGALLVLASASAWRASKRADLRNWAQALAGGLALAVIVFAWLLVPRINPVKSARSLALWVAARPEHPRSIACAGVQPEGFRFYGRLPAEKDDLVRALARERSEFLGLASEDAFARLSNGEQSGFRVLHRGRLGTRDVLVFGAQEHSAPRSDG